MPEIIPDISLNQSVITSHFTGSLGSFKPNRQLAAFGHGWAPLQRHDTVSATFVHMLLNWHRDVDWRTLTQHRNFSIWTVDVYTYIRQTYFYWSQTLCSQFHPGSVCQEKHFEICPQVCFTLWYSAASFWFSSFGYGNRMFILWRYIRVVAFLFPNFTHLSTGVK